MTIREEELIRDKLQFYKDRDLPVHINLKRHPDYPISTFRNGKTFSINDDFIEFDDEKLGVIIIYLSEIWGVEKRGERK